MRQGCLWCTRPWTVTRGIGLCTYSLQLQTAEDRITGNRWDYNQFLGKRFWQSRPNTSNHNLSSRGGRVEFWENFTKILIKSWENFEETRAIFGKKFRYFWINSAKNVEKILNKILKVPGIHKCMYAKRDTTFIQKETKGGSFFCTIINFFGSHFNEAD